MHINQIVHAFRALVAARLLLEVAEKAYTDLSIMNNNAQKAQSLLRSRGLPLPRELSEEKLIELLQATTRARELASKYKGHVAQLESLLQPHEVLLRALGLQLNAQKSEKAPAKKVEVEVKELDPSSRMAEFIDQLMSELGLTEKSKPSVQKLETSDVVKEIFGSAFDKIREAHGKQVRQPFNGDGKSSVHTSGQTAASMAEALKQAAAEDGIEIHVISLEALREGLQKQGGVEEGDEGEDGGCSTCPNRNVCLVSDAKDQAAEQPKPFTSAKDFLGNQDLAMEYIEKRASDAHKFMSGLKWSTAGAFELKAELHGGEIFIRLRAPTGPNKRWGLWVPPTGDENIAFETVEQFAAYCLAKWW